MASNHIPDDSPPEVPRESLVQSQCQEEEKLRVVALKHLAILMEQPNWNRTYCRSVLSIDPLHLPNHLTGTSLAGPDQLYVRPFVLLNDIDGAVTAFYHLGKTLEGHSGRVHGGLVTSLLDECMGRASFPRLPNRVTVTARLEIDFRAPIPSNSMVMIQAHTEAVEGRKAWVMGTVTDPSTETLLAQAKALFVEPKGAKDMPKLM